MSSQEIEKSWFGQNRLHQPGINTFFETDLTNLSDKDLSKLLVE